MTARRATGLLLCASLLLALTAAELGFRVWERRAARRHVDSDAPVIDLGRLNYNEGSVARRKPDDELRILSFGDSFAYTITRRAYSYPAVAAALLGRTAAGRRVRIVNLGEPSISFRQYAKGYRYWGAILEHDAVVFTLYVGNDLLDVAYGWVPDEAELNRVYGELDFDVQTGAPRRQRVPERFPLRMLDYAYALIRSAGLGRARGGADGEGEGPYSRALVELSEADYFDTVRLHLDNYDPDKLERLAEGYAALGRLLELASGIRRSGRGVLVLLAPEEIQVEDDLRDEVGRRFAIDVDRLDLRLPQARIARIAERIDPELPVLDLLPAFRCARERGQDLYYGTDTHWSVAGNRLAGQLLAAFVADRWLAAPRPAVPADLAGCIPPAGASSGLASGAGPR